MILSGVDNEHRLTHVIVDALRGRSRGAARARVEPTIPIGRGVARWLIVEWFPYSSYHHLRL